MKHQIIPLQFENNPVRVITDASGEPWFNAKEICDVLGYGNHRQAVDTHVDMDDVQKLDAIDSMGRKQLANHINESGLYALIFGSTKDEAKRFKRWVTSEVLPTIRKTGSYTAPAAKAKAQTLPGAAAAFKSMHSLAKLVGLDGNQALLCANNAVFKHEGVNCLELLGQTALTAEDQRGRTYTATQIGNCFLGLSGGCGAKVNKMLEQSGVMKRGEGNRPEPTESGRKHGEWADTGKHHGGAPVKEWRWFDTVIPFVQRSAERKPLQIKSGTLKSATT